MVKKFINIPDGAQLTENIDSDLVVISEDKIENILNRHISNIESRRNWVTPVSLGVGILLTFATADFNKNFLGIASDSWKLLFIVAFVICCVWTVFGVVQAIKGRKSTTVPYLVKQFYKNRQNKD